MRGNKDLDAARGIVLGIFLALVLWFLILNGLALTVWHFTR